MTGDSGQPIHTPGVVSDYFAVESHLLSTRTADAYKAVDKSRNTPVCLWLMKHPLAIGSDAVRRFLARMAEIDGIEPPVSKMTAYGVDAEGVAFCLLAPLDGYSVVSGNIEPTEAERRFMSCLRFVDRLHASGVVCGDLCGSCFWVDRVGDISIIGLMGSFDTEAVATAMLPPMETLPFIAPEQRTGGGVESASDVFALGVLGYYMLTHAYPYGQGTELFMVDFDLARVPSFYQTMSTPPVWAPEVIFKCLDPKPEARYSNAGAVLKAVAEVRQRSFSEERIPVIRGERSASLVGAARQSELAVTGTRLPKQSSQAITPPPPPAKSRLKQLFLGLLAVVLVLVVSDLYRRFRSRPKPKPAPQAGEISSGVGNPDLGGPATALGTKELTKAQFETELNKLRDSDDPLAHHLLIKSIKEAKTEEERRMAEKALLDRARRMGALRAVEQVKPWLRKVRPDQAGVNYEAILKTLDSTLPMDERGALLRQAYQAEPELVLRLTAALALDSEKLEQYQPILAQLIGDALDIQNAGDYSSLALILAHYQLAQVFGDDIVQNREKLTNQDILWILRILAERNDINTRAIANLAVQRGILTPLREIFLKAVRDKGDLPQDILGALIRSAGGALRPEDLTAFGRWFDIDAESILLAICADNTNKQTLVEAFDILAGKGPTIEPSAALIEWIRLHHWNERGDFAHVVGVMAYLSIIEPKQVQEAFSALDPYVEKSDLISILLDTKNPVVLRILFERYPNSIDLGYKLEFLNSPDKEIRRAVIPSFNPEPNNVGALKIIINAYEREKDPEMKKLYRERFGIIREREGGM